MGWGVRVVVQPGVRAWLRLSSVSASRLRAPGVGTSAPRRPARHQRPCSPLTLGLGRTRHHARTPEPWGGGGRRPCGARCDQPPADPRPQGAQGVPGPAPPSGRPAATSTGPRPPRSPKTRVAAAPHRPPQSVWLSATAAPMPGGSAAAWRARRKECGGGHGERRGVSGPGSSRWAPAATTPMTAARFDQRLTTISSQLLANCTLLPQHPSRWDRFQAP